ncbi:AAA family ATPase [Chitinophaga ginsengisegetis]|uniref:AAA family ATPase n=1 Tax=Chitinophaga ginsengisegetis TaxID=393003 RepID=UPI000DBA7347|nr:AAA family ATPase [Chitinophaga ginsengisegetis]MDR6569098.1 putative ATPase [Chitinophaga ginsengisegetis]MDR6648873.1 putative ATPase [Chitinophaga ginsengisegetis]MDR6655179.1 putative ATPase [Chitinophaga ginsengisegetis]
MLTQRGLTAITLNREKITAPGEYPFNIPALKNLSTLQLHPKVTYLSGENGMGKSTLIEAIAVACGFNPEGGSLNFTFSTRASHSVLHQYIRVARAAVRAKNGFFLRGESFFNVGTNIEELDKEGIGPRVIDSYGGVSLHEQSHGEAFWSLLVHRFSGNGLYILDEPEAALSPTRQMAMLSRMHQLIGQQSQFIIATHSPIVMAYPDSIIYQLTENGIKKTSYTETENYKVSHRFINDYKNMVKILLEDI